MFGREPLDDSKLLLAEGRFGRADARQLVVVDHAKAARLDSLIDPIAESLLEIIHEFKLSETSSHRYVT